MASSVNEAILIGWLLTIIFAVTAGIAFASIADVTLSRASRTTPAVQTAQAALADAMAARECQGGIGKFCRERKRRSTNGAKHWTLPCSRSDRRRTRKPMLPFGLLRG